MKNLNRSNLRRMIISETKKVLSEMRGGMGGHMGHMSAGGAPHPDSPEYETLGGLILSSLSNLPEENQKINIKNHIFLVSKVSDNLIEEVILVLNNK